MSSTSTRSTAQGGPQLYITIGTQNWTRRNLDVVTYRNGDTIPEVTDSTAWKNLTTGAWCYYNNDPALGAIYGRLYNWYAVTDPRGLAPRGMHIPTLAERDTLADFVGYSGGELKETGFAHWNSPNTGATNITGFTALGAGGRSGDSGNFAQFNNYGIWWLNDTVFGYSAYFYVVYNSTNIGRTGYYAKEGYSVRCIKD
jgi:hypothetical protein